MITQEELKRLLHYEPDTGVFTWLVKASVQVNAGDIAGKTNTGGYRQIKIGKIDYMAHRLAFLYMTGAFPKEHTDHVNGIVNDNRWLNLRRVNHAENMKNKKRYSVNSSGFTGVTWSRSSQKWLARITDSKKLIYLGYFDNKNDAVLVRKRAEKALGYHHNHGRSL